MILSLTNSTETKQGFIVMPNRAMPWPRLVCIYGIFAGFTLGIAAGFFARGFILILPFAGLELLALGIALYVSARRGGIREVITVTNETVRVETGRSAPEQSHEFRRPWSQVVLQRSWNNWYPSRLLIRSHGRSVEIGRFLNEGERNSLAGQLRKMIHGNPD